MNSIALKSPQFAKNCFWALPKITSSCSSSFSCAFPFDLQRWRIRASSARVAAAHKHNSRKKDDTHSFVPRPDEATGPFPESVLLKEKKVEEGGKFVPEFADVEERELFEALNLQLESDLNVEQMRHYEVVYLIHEDHKEEVENVNNKIQEFMKEKKGKIWRFSDWGMRRLAYKIQKAKSAHYILMNFELEAKWINDFKSMLDRDERVIRHLVMKKDRAETYYCPPPPEFLTMGAEANKDEDEDWDDEGDVGEDEDEDESIIYVEGGDDDEDEDESIIYVEGGDDDEEEETSSSERKKPEVQRLGV